MPLDFKKTGIRGKAAERALARRVADEPLTTKTERQIQIELNNQMSRTSFATVPAHPVSSPIQSQLHREFVKDAKVADYSTHLLFMTAILFFVTLLFWVLYHKYKLNKYQGVEIAMSAWAISGILYILYQTYF